MSLPDLFNLTGKVALVTGASRGLGQAMAIGLAEAGADIVSASRQPSADETAAGVTALGRKFHHLPLDLSTASNAELADTISQVVAKMGRLDILINNAGMIRRSFAIDVTEASWDKVMQVNLKASFFLAQAAAKQMQQQGGGKIIFTSSVLGEEGGLTVISYATSKHGINGMVKALSNEWAGANINVNGIAPGYFATDMTQALQEDSDRKRALLERIPAGRFGTSDELKGITVFLASAASSYAHGSIFTIDGGWLGR